MIEFIINDYMLAFGMRLFMPNIGPISENPIQRGLYTTTEPVLRVIRQIVIRGEPRFDWSPIFAILLLVIVRGVMVGAVTGISISVSILSGLVDVFDFGVRVLAILFLGAFFISIETSFAFSQSGQLMHNMAHFFLSPIRRFTGYRAGQVDRSALIGILILGIFHGLVLFQTDTVSGTETRVVFEVVVRSIIYVIDFIFDVLFIVILVRAILSFFNPDASNSFFQMLILYSDPILLPIRRLLPASAGIDFSPLIAILIIRFVQLSIMPLLFPF